MNTSTIRFLICALGICTLFFISCNKDDDSQKKDNSVASYDAHVILEWNKMFLEIERYAAGYRPGPAPRALGLMGLSVYEACISGMPDYNSIYHRYPGLEIPQAEGSDDHWPTVIHAVYSYLIPKIFPNINSSVKPQVEGLINSLNAENLKEAGNERYERSYKYGQDVASAVWDWFLEIRTIQLSLIGYILLFRHFSER